MYHFDVHVSTSDVRQWTFNLNENNVCEYVGPKVTICGET